MARGDAERRIWRVESRVDHRVIAGLLRAVPLVGHDERDAQVDRYDAACQRVATSSNRASTGTITLDSVSSAGYAGQLAVTLETGDSITGTFTAPICDSLTQVLDADRALGTCTP